MIKSILLISVLFFCSNEICLSQQVKFRNSISDSKTNFDTLRNEDVNYDMLPQSIRDSMKLSDDWPIEVLDTMPKFPGGIDSLAAFICNNINYSNIHQEIDAEGIILIRFVVTKTGKIKDARIIRSLESSYDKEALRIVSLMPDFIPGQQNGRNAAVYYTLPIKFRIQK